ncbi:MAG: class I SAM-dependent methyltransferase [Planctomycetota bacterium]
MTKTKYHSFGDFAYSEYTPTLEGKIAANLMVMYRKAAEKIRPVILELGTGSGQSTTVFLQACEEKDGRLVSVDIVDRSDITDSSRCQFVRSDSTNIEFILSQAPHLKEGIDILYIDSLHKWEHVKKELEGWYPYMNAKSWIFAHDVDSHPYRTGSRKDNYGTELALDEILEYLQSFYYANEEDLYLSVQYGSTGLACFYKLSPKGTPPEDAEPIVHRGGSIVHMVRHVLRKLRPRFKRDR